MGDETKPPLRYAVLHHEGVAEPHFDLMLESAVGGPLATWRLPEWPVTRPTQIEKLPDHRALYLDYEGPLSGDRGQVRRVEAGTYTTSPQWDDPYVFDLRLKRPRKLFCRRFRLLAPPDHPWSLEPG